MCSRSRTETATALLLLGALLALGGCGGATAPPLPVREGSQTSDVIDSALNPGVDHSAVTADPRAAQFYDNPTAVQTGKLLFGQFNCSGCHSNGGGGMGPSLMDDEWIYGDRLEQIHQSIVQGRPNGMPSWGGKIPDQQIWQIAAYVRSMSLPATLAAQNGPTPSQSPASIPADSGQDNGWSPPDTATNHYTTTTKGPQ